MECMSVEHRKLHVPPLEEVAKVLEEGLKQNFADVSVKVVDCPDLTVAPYHLAAPGLGGSPRLVDCGGEKHLLPTPNLEHYYDLKKLPKLCDMENALIIGAGAGPYKDLGVNSELMVNMLVTGDTVKMCSSVATLTEDEKCKLTMLDSHQTGNALLSNVYLSQGKPGKVLEIIAGVRTGEECFTSSMRKTLLSQYGEQLVSLGGVFLMEEGEGKYHIMRDLSKTPLHTKEDVNNWLTFHTYTPTVCCLSVLITADPGLNLRLEHSHGYNSHGQGGHYHYDTTPATTKYRGYYNVAEVLYRVDKPVS